MPHGNKPPKIFLTPVGEAVGLEYGLAIARLLRRKELAKRQSAELYESGVAEKGIRQTVREFEDEIEVGPNTGMLLKMSPINDLEGALARVEDGDTGPVLNLVVKEELVSDGPHLPAQWIDRSHPVPMTDKNGHPSGDFTAADIELAQSMLQQCREFEQA